MLALSKILHALVHKQGTLFVKFGYALLLDPLVCSFFRCDK
jgi:hypothetical protein